MANSVFWLIVAGFSAGAAIILSDGNSQGMVVVLRIITVAASLAAAWAWLSHIIRTKKLMN